MVYITVIVCSSYLPFLTRARGRQSSFCGRPVGMTQREIAEQVGMSLSGVNKLVHQTANAEQWTSSGNEANGKDKARQAMEAEAHRKGMPQKPVGSP